jgi:hypothetical protein
VQFNTSLTLSPEFPRQDLTFAFNGKKCLEYTTELDTVTCAPGRVLRGGKCELDEDITRLCSSAQLCIDADGKCTSLVSGMDVPNNSVLRINVSNAAGTRSVNVSVVAKSCSDSTGISDGTASILLGRPGEHLVAITDGKSSCSVLESVAVGCPKRQKLYGETCRIACNDTTEVLTDQGCSAVLVAAGFRSNTLKIDLLKPSKGVDMSPTPASEVAITPASPFGFSW